MIKWNFLFQIFIFYCIATLFVYLVSDFFIFLSPKPSSYQQNTLKTIPIKTEDGQTISALYLENPKAEYTVLFSHGNAEDLGTLLPYLETYRENGFSIFAYDYHGYGTSTGRSSEPNTYLDIQAAYRYLVEVLKIPDNKIILHGRSIGTGPTLELAQYKRFRGVILESPMVTAFRVLTMLPLFPLDKYRNNNKIIHVKSPLLIIHALQDNVIPFWHGEYLYNIAPYPKKLVPIPNANHNDILINASTLYWNTIRSFAAYLSKF